MDYIECYKDAYKTRINSFAIDRIVEDWYKAKQPLTDVLGIAPTGFHTIGCAKLDESPAIMSSCEDIAQAISLLGVRRPTIAGVRDNQLPDGARLSRTVVAAVNAMSEEKYATNIAHAAYWLRLGYNQLSRHTGSYGAMPDIMKKENIVKFFQQYYNMMGYRRELTVAITTDPLEIIGASLNASFTTCTAPTGSFSASNFVWAKQPNTAMVIAYGDSNKTKIGRALIHVAQKPARIIVNRVYGINECSKLVNLVSGMFESVYSTKAHSQYRLLSNTFSLTVKRERLGAHTSRAPYVDKPTAIIGKDGTRLRGTRLPVELPVCIICGIRHIGSLCVCQGCR